MAKCNCQGSTCSCLITGGTGVEVSGTGTKADPYVIGRDTSTDTIDSQITFTDTATVSWNRLGSGSNTDPIIMRASVILTSPNGTQWAPSISNSGALTWAAI